MALVPQLSVTAKQTFVKKTQIRSAPLSCFSKLQNSTKPFFRQWHVHAVDISKIMSVSYAGARQMMQELRRYYGKSKREIITIEEFSAFSGKSKSYVRMHVVSRAIEHELKKQCSLGRVQIPNLKFQDPDLKSQLKS